MTGSRSIEEGSSEAEVKVGEGGSSGAGRHPQFQRYFGHRVPTGTGESREGLHLYFQMWGLTVLFTDMAKPWRTRSWGVGIRNSVPTCI